MRRALLRQWPALSRYYGLFPWDVDRLTVDEIDEYLRQWRQYVDEQNRRERQTLKQRRRG